MIEIGGTVGDISLPFLEAIRQLRNDGGRQHVACPCATGHALRLGGASSRRRPPSTRTTSPRIGIEPDVWCGTNRPPTGDIREKIALYGGIPAEAVIYAIEPDDIYEVPLNLEDEGFARVVASG